MRKTPPIVSKRNHFSPADEFVENHLFHLPKEYQHENFRKWLLHYTEVVIRGVARDFGTAAERGIEQAANLLCDPEFYETKKQERARWRKQMKEDKVKQDWERLEKETCPTKEQIAKDIDWHERQVTYYIAQADAYQRKVDDLKEKASRIVESAWEISGDSIQ